MTHTFYFQAYNDNGIPVVIITDTTPGEYTPGKAGIVLSALAWLFNLDKFA